MPHVELPAEPLVSHPLSLPLLGQVYLTNTLVAMLLVDAVVLALVFAVRKAAQSGDLVPRGISGAFEALIEAIYNLTESTAGKWAESIFPYFATIFIMVLIANYMELLPGVDSIGWLARAEHAGHAARGIFLLKDGGEYTVVPWVRVLSTDLNFTLALALVAVFMSQVIGVRALGLPYFGKFFNIKALFTVRPRWMGLIDFLVSILEIISEVAKIISFSFRLFGNLFAGSVMLFVIGFLVPIWFQSAVLLLEAFVGVIQALVFGLLTLMFMSLATHPHGGEHEEAHA
jgi:F-type H+-transporting ATPase subunit a